MRVPRPVLRLVWANHRFLDRITGGRFDAGRFGNPSLWLTTVGRRTGQRRETALTFLVDGRNLIVVASNVGEDTDPAWWLNLRAAPDATIRLAGQPPRPTHAREALDPERAELWERFVARYPGYRDYQRRTTRRLPVIVLEPRDGPTSEPAPASAPEAGP